MRANTGFQSASDQKADSSEAVLHRLDEVGQRRVEAFTALAHQMAWKAARFYACDMPADELVAEALLGLTYASCLFDEERGVPFGAYATMVIRHRLIHAVRSWRQAKRPKRMPAPCTETDSDWEPEARPEIDPHARLAAGELCDRVRRVLPASWFDVLRLYHADGYTMAQIGSQFGVSRQRIRQILVKATDRVRRNFPDWEF